MRSLPRSSRAAEPSVKFVVSDRACVTSESHTLNCMKVTLFRSATSDLESEPRALLVDSTARTGPSHSLTAVRETVGTVAEST